MIIINQYVVRLIDRSLSRQRRQASTCVLQNLPKALHVKARDGKE
ncbi:hypothetical protein [Bartonella japonica]